VAWQHPGVDARLTEGDRWADKAVKAMGSWAFLLTQTLFIAVWMALNVVAWCHHWDPRPFIMLNLVFSIQAAYAAPLVLLAQRRSDKRASELAEHDHLATQESLTILRRLEGKHQ
jgi:uncharacterized membrane protein